MRKNSTNGPSSRRRKTIATTCLVSGLAFLGTSAAAAAARQTTGVVLAKMSAACSALEREGNALDAATGEDAAAIIKSFKAYTSSVRKYDRAVSTIRPAVKLETTAIAELRKYNLALLAERAKLAVVAAKGDRTKFIGDLEAAEARLAAKEQRALSALDAAGLPVCGFLFGFKNESEANGARQPDAEPTTPIPAVLLPTSVPGYVIAPATNRERADVATVRSLTPGAYDALEVLRLNTPSNGYVATVLIAQFNANFDEPTRRRVFNIGMAAVDLKPGTTPVNGFDVSTIGTLTDVTPPQNKAMALRGSLLVEFTAGENPDLSVLGTAVTAYLTAFPPATA